MLGASGGWNRPIFTAVTLRSRLWTALNVLLSMATMACEDRFNPRHGRTRRRQTFWMPVPRLRQASGRQSPGAPFEFNDESVDHPDRVVFGDKVVGTLGRQRHLASTLAHDESRHALPSIAASARHGTRPVAELSGASHQASD
jgi:hypothetical protein